MSLPSVSVVIAAWRGGEGVERGLAALEKQRGEALEILVPSAGVVPDGVKQRYPWARFLEGRADDLVPVLWARGIEGSSGDVVATTTTHFVVGPAWIRAIREAHARLATAAIGGPILLPAAAPRVGAATFFLRYSRYLSIHGERDITELAGDNASYRRTALEAHPHRLKDGFWEHGFHRDLLREGERLVFLPSMTVTQASSYGFLPFVGQRLRHGRYFGASRAEGFSAPRRLLFAGALPLIPPLFIARIFRNVRGSGLGRRLLGSLPLLLPFVSAWAVGEALGYLLGPARSK